jgi:cAMP phosphodiesterase
VTNGIQNKSFSFPNESSQYLWKGRSKDKAIAVSSTTADIVATSKQLQDDIQRVTSSEKEQRELLQVALTRGALLPNSPEKNVKYDQNIVLINL